MNVEIACTLRARLRGLYGRTRLDGVLLLVRCNDIHTFAMKRAIDVAFVARDGTVIESHRAVGPNHRLCNPRAVATLERFSGAEPWYEEGCKLQLRCEAMRACMPCSLSNEPLDNGERQRRKV